MQQQELEQLISAVGDKHNEVIRFKSAYELVSTIRKIAQGLFLSEKRVWELVQERGFERLCSETSNPDKLATFFLMSMTDEELRRALDNGAQLDIDFLEDSKES